MLSAAVVSDMVASPWFDAGWSPYLLLDTDLTMHAANNAYQRATAHRRDQLIGRRLFDVFPDNPADPNSDGVSNLSRSLETVLRTGKRHWMGYQRYDVPDPHAPETFLVKVWTPVNSPIIDNRRVVGVLHHVQDITPALQSVDRGSVNRYPPPDLEPTIEALQQQFPDAIPATVLGILTDSQRVVLNTIGKPDPARAASLARLRLEIATAHPALPAPGADRTEAAFDRAVRRQQASIEHHQAAARHHDQLAEQMETQADAEPDRARAAHLRSLASGIRQRADAARQRAEHVRRHLR